MYFDTCGQSTGAIAFWLQRASVYRQDEGNKAAGNPSDALTNTSFSRLRDLPTPSNSYLSVYVEDRNSRIIPASFAGLWYAISWMVSGIQRTCTSLIASAAAPTIRRFIGANSASAALPELSPQQLSMFCKKYAARFLKLARARCSGRLGRGRLSVGCRESALPDLHKPSFERCALDPRSSTVPSHRASARETSGEYLTLHEAPV